MLYIENISLKKFAHKLHKVMHIYKLCIDKLFYKKICKYILQIFRREKL